MLSVRTLRRLALSAGSNQRTQPGSGEEVSTEPGPALRCNVNGSIRNEILVIIAIIPHNSFIVLEPCSHVMQVVKTLDCSVPASR